MVTVAADLFESATFVRLDEGLVAPIGHRFTNPSIHPDADVGWALVRLVNYGLRGGRYSIVDPDGVVRTAVQRLEPADGGAPLHVVGLADLTTAPAPGVPIRGFEDCRVFRHDGRDHALAAVRDWNTDGIAQQCLLTLDGDEIVTAIALSRPDEGHQKNWMPVAGSAEMTFVDRCAPLRLRVVDPDTATVRVVDRPESDEPEARRFRGGSQVIRCGDQWLAVVHEVEHRASRVYTHRFVAFDDELRPVATTPPFSFTGAPVEFCAGLRLEDDELIASFGVGDAEAWLMRLPSAQAEAALAPFSRSEPARPPAAAPLARARSGLVAVTLAHEGREEPLGAALRSVADWVDRCLVIDTSGTPSVHAAAAAAVGERMLPAVWPWTGDFGEARTAALELAARSTDCEWAVIVDSDETLLVEPQTLPEGVGAALAALPAEVGSVSTWDEDGVYTKVRFVRLPSAGRFVGATHEYFDTAGHGQRVLAGVTFREWPKSATELEAKAERDIAALRRLTAARPREGRWWYYLADAFAIRGDRREAIAAFRRCAEVDSWAEEAAWACFREAQLWVAAGDHDTAIERCVAGLARHPGVAELAWYAGYAAYHGDRLRDAAAFANLAIVHGDYVGLAADTGRTSFRHVPALFEGPFDVLRHAYRRLGEADAAARAETDYERALTARLARRPPPA